MFAPDYPSDGRSASPNWQVQKVEFKRLT